METSKKIIPGNEILVYLTDKPSVELQERYWFLSPVLLPLCEFHKKSFEKNIGLVNNSTDYCYYYFFLRGGEWQGKCSCLLVVRSLNACNGQELSKLKQGAAHSDLALGWWRTPLLELYPQFALGPTESDPTVFHIHWTFSCSTLFIPVNIFVQVLNTTCFEKKKKQFT